MAKDPIKTLEALIDKLQGRVAAVLNRNTYKAHKKLVSQHLRGPMSSTAVDKKSMRKSQGIFTKYYKAEFEGLMVSTLIRSPIPWAGVHIGPRGSSTTVSAKSGFLAIPTDFAKQASTTRWGGQRGPKDQIWGPTKVYHGIVWGLYGGWSFIASGRVGKGASSEGMKQRRAAGEKFTKGQDLPLFILKKSIVIRRRVDPQVDVIDWIKPQYFEDLKKSVLKVD